MHPLLASAEAVFFDLDGTLVDSAADLHQSLSHALAQYALGTVTLQQVRDWIGRGAHALVASAVSYCLEQNSHCQPSHQRDHAALTDEVLTHFLRHYQCHACEQTSVYPSVIELLDVLANADKCLACITNKPIAPAKIVLSSLGLADYFTLVLGGDSLEKKKPHPLPLIYTLAHFDLAASQAVMVGDSMFDVQAAQAANMPCIALSTGYNHGKPIIDASPDLVIASFRDVL